MNDVHYHEMRVEVFERAGVSDELLECWQTLEVRSLTTNTNATLLPRFARDGVLRCIGAMAQETGCSSSAFFRCIALLDSFSRLSPPGVGVGATPVVCAAIVGIVRKDEDSTAYVNYFELGQHALRLSQWLATNGCPPESAAAAMIEDEIIAREMLILDAFGLIIHIPTIESWLAVMADRLHILTRGIYVQQMMLQTHLARMMRLIVLRQTSSTEFTMRDAACGLLGLGLICARIVPAAVLKSDDMPADEWDSLLSAGALPDGRVHPPALAAQDNDFLLKQLARATDRNIGAIQADCERAARAVAAVTVAFRTHNQFGI